MATENQDNDYQRSDYQRLYSELQDLKADYEQLSIMFENMGLGYEEALMLYDRAVESSRMKTNFIQQISHEIRTPLNILSGFTQILTTPGMELDDAMKQEVSKGVAENTQRITGLVNKMLELSEAGSDTPLERTDDVLAVQIAAQAAEDSNITLADHVQFDLQIGDGADTVMLHTNLQQATRALALLLDNAGKFTRPAEAALAGGTAVKQAQVVLRIAVVDNMCEMSVEDTGIGLTVARSIARRLGGDIVLDTNYTGGARFVFTLPMN